MVYSLRMGYLDGPIQVKVGVIKILAPCGAPITAKDEDVELLMHYRFSVLLEHNVVLSRDDRVLKIVVRDTFKHLIY